MVHHGRWCVVHHGRWCVVQYIMVGGVWYIVVGGVWYIENQNMAYSVICTTVNRIQIMCDVQ